MLTIEQTAKLEALQRKAETGEQWAEIARLEAEMIALNRHQANPSALPVAILEAAGFVREPDTDGIPTFSPPLLWTQVES